MPDERRTRFPDGVGAGWHQYELVGPRDGVTFRAPSDAVAWLLVVFFGNGKLEAARVIRRGTRGASLGARVHTALIWAETRAAQDAVMAIRAERHGLDWRDTRMVFANAPAMAKAARTFRAAGLSAVSHLLVALAHRWGAALEANCAGAAFHASAVAVAR